MRALRVEVHINRGRVEVSGGPFEEVEVDGDDGLRVTRHRDRVSIKGNDADCVVYAPESVVLKLHANDAVLTVLGIAGVEVRLNDGEIDIGDVTGAVDLRGNRLDVALDNVDGPISVRANRGEVFVRVAPGHRVRSDIKVDQGDVVNAVPAGSDVSVKVRLNQGDVEIVEGVEIR